MDLLTEGRIMDFLEINPPSTAAEIYVKADLPYGKTLNALDHLVECKRVFKSRGTDGLSRYSVMPEDESAPC